MMRKELLANDEVYHIYTKSIANYKVFNRKNDYERMIQVIKYYQKKNEIRFSYFIKLKIVLKEGFTNAFYILSKDKDSIIQIIAYCIMPTHIHLILKQLTEGGISNYISSILNSYTHYFNTTHKRKGPLWESRFKSVLVDNDEQLLHLTRYLHLNPVTAKMVDKPEQWSFSSYLEFIRKVEEPIAVCQYDDLLDIEPSYGKFVINQISHQRELATIKKLLLDA